MMRPAPLLGAALLALALSAAAQSTATNATEGGDTTTTPSTTPTTTSSTTTTTTNTRWPAQCTQALCADDPDAELTCHPASNTVFFCRYIALCEGYDDADLISGHCNKLCAGGLERADDGSCSLRPRIRTAKPDEETQSQGNRFTELTLQAGIVSMRTWDDEKEEVVRTNLMETLGDLGAATASLEAEVELKANSDETFTRDEVTQQLAALEGRVAAAQRVADVEDELAEKADASYVDAVSTVVDGKAEAADVYTREQVDGAVQGVRDDVTALDSKVDDKADEANVQSLADAVNGRLDDLEESKAEKASVYTKGEVTGLLDALELDPATSANSPDCVTAEIGKTRLNLETATVEVCVEGTLSLHWRPLGSIKDCARVDRFRRCDLCAPGMVLSRGACILRADFVHIDMDGESDDTAVGAGAYP